MLDLHDNRKTIRHSLTLNLAIETPIPLDGIDMDLLFAGPRQDFKAFEHATPQTGELAHNDARNIESLT
jgi:hypothetical protein